MTVEEIVETEAKSEPVAYSFELEALSRMILIMLRDGRALLDIEQVVALDRSIVEDEVIRLLRQELLLGTLSNPVPSERALEILNAYERERETI